MEFVPTAVAIAMVWRIVTFLKSISAGAFRDAITQILVWVAGTVVAFVVRASDFSASWDVAGVPLKNLNVASVILFGFALGSAASVAYEFKKARDGSESAVEPKLGVKVANG